MQDYLKSTKIEFDPKILLILNSGRNNLSTNDSPELIAGKVVETVKSLKTRDINVVLSAIGPRCGKLNEKIEKVNYLLEKVWNQKQTNLLKHSNISTKKHLNRRIFFHEIVEII